MIKKKNLNILKKLIYGLLLALVMIFAYQYQKPILETGRVLAKVEEHIKNQEIGGEDFSDIKIKDLSPKDIDMFLTKKEGFFNRLTNQQQWHITVDYKGSSPTIVLDAYDGKFIRTYGPLD
ncbi:hypothetical protein [Viridibacillus arvi]|uniref:hypothetical protein n=1 Tax=Viridibacillus arvi TaxID=263475 RepID=UPI00187BB620|nr:hypothetical protein [Viridibacillus sp. JNUCC-6]QOV12631.1 hypothetical protein JNUCC6_07715 [Viridibacillus sp. JNUCC-6]